MIPSPPPLSSLSQDPAGKVLQKNDSRMASNRRGQFRLIGHSVAIERVRERILRLADSQAPVAICGESGSGKELAARDIHDNSARAGMPFVAVNCGAIPEALMEAEFFGYRRGAFTGASEDHDGFFRAAHGGTVLLDEVADLPLAMQVKLLRVIQEKRVRKLGAVREEVVDVRIISATHHNLARCVLEGRFRQDLYYRLNVIELQLPPLRARPEDIASLAQAMLLRQAGSGRQPVLSELALAALCAHDFPGNVRELENILERALAFADGNVIESDDLDFDCAASLAPRPASLPAVSHAVEQEAGQVNVAGSTLPLSLTDHLQNVERDLVLQVLQHSRFDLVHAAALLGISFRQLRYRMQRLAIHDPH